MPPSLPSGTGEALSAKRRNKRGIFHYRRRLLFFGAILFPLFSQFFPHRNHDAPLSIAPEKWPTQGSRGCSSPSPFIRQVFLHDQLQVGWDLILSFSRRGKKITLSTHFEMFKFHSVTWSGTCVSAWRTSGAALTRRALVNGSRWFSAGHENVCRRAEWGFLPCSVSVRRVAQHRRAQGWHACVWLIINQPSLGSLSTSFTASDRHPGSVSAAASWPTVYRTPEGGYEGEPLLCLLWVQAEAVMKVAQWHSWDIHHSNWQWYLSS